MHSFLQLFPSEQFGWVVAFFSDGCSARELYIPFCNNNNKGEIKCLINENGMQKNEEIFYPAKLCRKGEKKVAEKKLRIGCEQARRIIKVTAVSFYYLLLALPDRQQEEEDEESTLLLLLMAGTLRHFLSGRLLLKIKMGVEERKLSCSRNSQAADE